MRAVGLLLVSALMVIPVAAAQQIARGFKATMHIAMLFGLAAAALGIWISGTRDTAPGATIVLVAIAGFLIAAIGTGALRSARRTRPQVPTTTAAEPALAGSATAGATPPSPAASAPPGPAAPAPPAPAAPAPPAPAAPAPPGAATAGAVPPGAAVDAGETDRAAGRRPG
jgi:hypothetical protein